MPGPPLGSLRDYSSFLAELLSDPQVKHSTVAGWSSSTYTGIVEGEILFANGIRLRLREELDFEAGLITSYGYEVYRRETRPASCIEKTARRPWEAVDTGSFGHRTQLAGSHLR